MAKVGGYRDYFSPEDLAFTSGQMKKLDSRFGFAA